MFQHKQIAIAPLEGHKKPLGPRVIKGFELELHENIAHTDISGRTDWFQGRAYHLSLEQAEDLYSQLGRSLTFIKNLENDGKVVTSRQCTCEDQVLD